MSSLQAPKFAKDVRPVMLVNKLLNSNRSTLIEVDMFWMANIDPCLLKPGKSCTTNTLDAEFASGAGWVGGRPIRVVSKQRPVLTIFMIFFSFDIHDFFFDWASKVSSTRAQNYSSQTSGPHKPISIAYKNHPTKNWNPSSPAASYLEQLC